MTAFNMETKERVVKLLEKNCFSLTLSNNLTK